MDSAFLIDLKWKRRKVEEGLSLILSSSSNCRTKSIRSVNLKRFPCFFFKFHKSIDHTLDRTKTRRVANIVTNVERQTLLRGSIDGRNLVNSPSCRRGKKADKYTRGKKRVGMGTREARIRWKEEAPQGGGRDV